MTEIEMATTDELINEIAKRNDIVVLVIHKQINPKEEEDTVFYRGGKIPCLGLAEYARKQIHQHISEGQEEDRPE